MLINTCQTCTWRLTCVRVNVSHDGLPCGYWEPSGGCDGECRRCTERQTCPGWDDLRHTDADTEPMIERSTQ